MSDDKYIPQVGDVVRKQLIGRVSKVLDGEPILIDMSDPQYELVERAEFELPDEPLGAGAVVRVTDLTGTRPEMFVRIRSAEKSRGDRPWANNYGGRCSWKVLIESASRVEVLSQGWSPPRRFNSVEELRSAREVTVINDGSDTWQLSAPDTWVVIRKGKVRWTTSTNLLQFPMWEGPSPDQE